MSTAKDEAIKAISRLPEEASWDEIMYKIYVKRKIEEGLKAADEGRTVSHEEVKEMFQASMKILWTDPAIEDLRNLHSYIAKDSEVYASSFVERIILAVEKLMEFSRGRAEWCQRLMRRRFENFCITTIASSIVSMMD